MKTIVHNRAQSNVHTSVEYLNGNVSIGQLLQHISKSIVVCARSRPIMLTKTDNNNVCQASEPFPFINFDLEYSDFFL